jgi:hypothetical protein
MPRITSRLSVQNNTNPWKISFNIPGQNGQVSRLDRPNEWVKFKKFQQKFGEFERAQVRGFLREEKYMKSVFNSGKSDT